ncbi:hypothetical protein [Sorangium sp. So ce854]|uniref:hypothetical protein n=1 Tax=Sorangium sp. So ce854 TaxID=3133322 RepID=UPI003F5E4FA7
MISKLISLAAVLLMIPAFGVLGCAVEAGEDEAAALDGGEEEVAEASAAATSRTKNACCNKTASGGLTGCTKPYYPPNGGATCVGEMVKAKCDARYNNCTESRW